MKNLRPRRHAKAAKAIARASKAAKAAKAAMAKATKAAKAAKAARAKAQAAKTAPGHIQVIFAADSSPTGVWVMTGAETEAILGAATKVAEAQGVPYYELAEAALQALNLQLTPMVVNDPGQAPAAVVIVDNATLARHVTLPEGISAIASADEEVHAKLPLVAMEGGRNLNPNFKFPSPTGCRVLFVESNVGTGVFGILPHRLESIFSGYLTLAAHRPVTSIGEDAFFLLDLYMWEHGSDAASKEFDAVIIV